MVRVETVLCSLRERYGKGFGFTGIPNDETLTRIVATAHPDGDPNQRKRSIISFSRDKNENLLPQVSGGDEEDFLQDVVQDLLQG